MTDQHIRQQFPSLQRQHNGRPVVFLDGPAGTQVPASVIEAISDYYRRSNANTHGQFATTHETDEMLESVREKAAAFLGAPSGRCISYGANMTTLNYSLSRAIGRALQPGDEILITQLDHEANRGPWLALRSEGIEVREVRLLPDGRLDYDDFYLKINERTRLVAMGWASNILGTVNEVERVRRMTHETGAWLLLDAVHYAPHLPMDVHALGCDFLLCSAYKFYGPHVGLLYARPGLLDSLPCDRLRVQEQQAPYCIETGTLNHAAIAGVGAAIDFIAQFGEGETLRQRLHSAMCRVQQWEGERFQQLFEGLQGIKGLKTYGQPAVPIAAGMPQRAPTVSFTIEGKSAEQVCRALGAKGIFAWDGNFYAVRAAEVLGLMPDGVTRMGISLYTTEEEVERVLEAVKRVAG